MPLQIDRDYILDLIENQDWDAMGSLFRELHPADISEVIETSPQLARERLFDLVPDDLKPDVLAELEEEAGTEVLDSLSASELSEIVEEMAPDDAADVLADLPEEKSEQVLGLMEAEEAVEVRELLKYDDDTAGGIMTTDVFTVRESQTVADTLQAVSLEGDDDDPVYNAYVVDDSGILIGYVGIWELLREKDKSRPLGVMAHRDFVAASTAMDQEEVAQLMARYDLDVLPVVDTDGRIVGRITNDDVIEVIEKEASEDILRLAGSTSAELEHASLGRSYRARLPWLLVTLAGGFITSLVLREFHQAIADVLILGAFVPIVLAMGGNTGIQASTLMVRSLALGGTYRRNAVDLLRREIAVGAVLGMTCGVIIGLWAAYVGSQGRGGPVFLAPWNLGVIVASALFCSMTFAAVFGAFVPVALDRLHVDPAVASGPFVTIANDLSALLIYFGVTALLMHAFHTGAPGLIP